MPNRLMNFLRCVALLLVAGAAVAQTAVAGRIDETQGDVRLYDPAQNMRIAKVGEVVNEGDSIVTGSDGEVHLAMADEGQIAVRPNTRLRIARYRADGGSGDTSIFALVQGALRSVTGWIGKYNAKGYAIRTPTATIGVRGTDHETMVLPTGSPDGEAGTYDKVNHGATLLSTQHGTTEVRPNQAAFVSLKDKAKPRLLSSVPAFYRTARLDPRFDRLHEKVRQELDTKRTQRIEAIKQRQLKPDEARRGKAADERATREGLKRGDTEQRAQQQQQRHEAAERRRQDQQRQYDERRQRLEEQRPGELRRSPQGRARQHDDPAGGSHGEGRGKHGGGRNQ